MKTKVLYTIAGIVVIILSVFITGKLIMSKPVPESNKQVISYLNVKAEVAKNSNYTSNIKYRGRISSYENVSLSAEVSGKIIQGDIPFKAGQEFTKGNVLVRIYNEDVKASLMSGKSSFMKTLSSILPDINYDFPDEYTKWKNFFNEIQVDKSLPELPKINSDQEQIFLASQGVLTAYYSLRQQEINLQKYTIYAPFNGTLKSVSKEIGAVTSMGAELASIIRTDKLEVTVPVLPEDAKWIKVGDPVELIGINQTETGKVSRIANFVDASTQSINIYINYYPNGNNYFLDGEYIDVKFEISKNAKGIKIPREALLNGNQIYVIQDESLIKKTIHIERSLDDYYIISGINDNEIIVTESLADVSEATKVKARM